MMFTWNFFLLETDSHEELIPPHFKQELRPQIGKVGGSVTFEAVLGGNPQPLVSWFREDHCVNNVKVCTIFFT